MPERAGSGQTEQAGQPGPPEAQASLDGAGRRVLVVVSRFNELETEQLLDGALECLSTHGVEEGDVEVIRVPGAFEIPGVIAAALRHDRYDGVVALGCVIRGETPHFDFVAGEAARGIQELCLAHDVPIAFGILTTDTREQALARAGGAMGNKGWESALTTLEMMHLYEGLRSRARTK